MAATVWQPMTSSCLAEPSQSTPYLSPTAVAGYSTELVLMRKKAGQSKETRRVGNEST